MSSARCGRAWWARLVLVLLVLPSAAAAQTVTLSVGDAAVVEGDVAAENVLLRFPLTLSAPPTKQVTVRFTTNSGTATAGIDYMHAANVLVTIPAGNTGGFADVAIIEDLNVEPDETLTVTLGSPTNALIAQSTATGTILNDDELVDVRPDSQGAHTVLAFEGVAPNPLVRGGMARFSLPVETTVRLEVFDIRGRRVARLCDGIFRAGKHAVGWTGASRDGGRLASGVYVARLEALGRVFTSPVTVLH
jgi:hypothetical protein